MNEIYNKINERTSGKYAMLRFPHVVMGDKAAVTVVCRPADRDFAERNAAELKDLIKSICGFVMPVDIVINSEPPTAISLRTAVVAFTDKFGYVASMSRAAVAEVEPKLKVKIKMHTAMYELAKDDYLPRLTEFLANNYVDEAALDVEVIEYSSEGRSAQPQKSARTEYEITDVTPIAGDLTANKARSVQSITESGYNVVVCGVYAMPIPYVSKGGRAYDKFLLYDGESTLQCRFFPSGGQSLADDGLIGKTVCAIGNVDYDKFRNEATLTVRELSLCKADGLSAVPARPEPERYTVVCPEEYEAFVQSSMFDGDLSVPPSLAGDFVVFDFETTGLSALYDKPTELGAVKLSNGRITHTFSTLIDPQRKIPPEVVEKTGITDEMVKGKPLFEDILPDFYKFTYGCGLVAHNITFDFPFLLGGGNRCGWAFGDRKTFDTMALAPRALPGISKLTLDKVLEGLGLSNDNAHRASADAAATAKAFVAMKKILHNI